MHHRHDRTRTSPSSATARTIFAIAAREQIRARCPSADLAGLERFLAAREDLARRAAPYERARAMQFPGMPEEDPHDAADGRADRSATRARADALGAEMGAPRRSAHERKQRRGAPMRASVDGAHCARNPSLQAASSSPPKMNSAPGITGMTSAHESRDHEQRAYDVIDDGVHGIIVPMSAVREAPAPGAPSRRGEVAAALARALRDGAGAGGERRRSSPTSATASRRIAPRRSSRRFPTDEAQVAAILASRVETKTPVVARGSGHGAFGRRAAARRRHPALAREVQPHRRGRSARARARACSPACTNLRDLAARRRTIGLYYAPDPSSQIACSIGGNVAENSGGVHCLKYGLTVHNIAKRARDHDRGRPGRPRQRRARRAGLRPARARHRLRGLARRSRSRSR